MSDTVTSPAEVPGGAVRIGTEPPATQERVVLFYIGDKPYSVPKTIPGATMLRMMELSISSGGTAALMYALVEGIGEANYEELRRAEALGQDDLKVLLARLSDLYVPQTEAVGKA
jgi:hypothetical protein